MNAFVEGKSRARRSRRRTDREELNREWGEREEKDALMHTHTHKQSQQRDRSSIGGPVGDLFDICSMRPIDICAMYLNASPFLRRCDGTHTGSRGVIKSCSYAFGIW